MLVDEYLHRVILNAPKGKYVDHINGNRLDNRRSNLRIVSAIGNGQNRPSAARSNSGYRGVCWIERRKQWEAYAFVNYKRAFHRYCATLAEAVRAVHEWRLAHMPAYVPDAKTLALLEKS